MGSPFRGVVVLLCGGSHGVADILCREGGHEDFYNFPFLLGETLESFVSMGLVAWGVVGQ